jgi:hypothetical protein
LTTASARPRIILLILVRSSGLPEADIATALHSLNIISSAADPRFSGTVSSLRQQVMKLQDSFNELVREQQALGFDENSGLQKKLRESGRAHHQ